MENIFNTADNEFSIDPEKNYFEELVGEGKKFKNEIELARSKAESDAFIEKLKRENAELRANTQKAATAEEILKKIQEAAQAKPATQEQVQVSNQSESNKGSSFSQEDLDKIIEEKLKAKESETQAERNYRQVVESMSAAWGEHNLQTELKRKASQLGMTTQQLQDVALSNPNAFLKLVDIQGNQQSYSKQSPATSTVNTSVSTSAGVRNKAYYDQRRKEMGNSAFFADKKLQAEMLSQAAALGNKFYE